MMRVLSAYQRAVVARFECLITSADLVLADAHDQLSACPGEWTLDASIARHNIAGAQGDLRVCRNAIEMVGRMTHEDVVARWEELDELYCSAGGMIPLVTVADFMAECTFAEGEVLS